MDAPKLALPAEICAQVVQYARFGDLPAIGRTSKAFQILAETRLYNHIIVKDMETLNRVGNSLFTPARGLARASYVRRLWVYRDPRTAEGPWRDAHWRVIVILLPMVINLDNLIVWDDTSVHTWCLDAPTIQFQVREANFVFNWDDSLASFLEGQHELRSLIIQAPDEDENTRRILAPGSLQKLESFDGPLFVAIDLMTSPLKRLCIRVDEENAPLFSSYITELSRVNKTLSSLNVLHVPEYLVADSLRVLALSPLSSSLRYLGIVNLPLGDRNDIYPSLLKLERLEVLHIDLSHWTPLPMPCHFPMLATELRTYCATLRCVVIWVHTQQWFGRHEPEQEHWVFQHLPGQRLSARDVQWRDY